MTKPPEPDVCSAQDVQHDDPVDAGRVRARDRTSVWTTVGLYVALLAMSAATVVVVSLVLAARTPGAQPAVPAPRAGVGTVTDEALPARIANLPLVDQEGHATDLAAFRGKVLMISDTMTLCQETCPLDTADLVQSARELNEDGLAGKVEFLTITVDPDRDTPAQLSAYRDLYKPAPSNWAALTGSPSVVSALWKYFGVYVQKVPGGSPPSVNWRTGQVLTYDLDHSDEVFFIDAKGVERYLLEGMGHVAPGTNVPEAMQSYLDAKGRANLHAPASGGWTIPQGLSVLSWLLQRPVPHVSGS